MSAKDLAVIVFVVLCGWMVWASLRAREAALAASRMACQAEGYLFLDDTVAIDSVRAVRNDEGRLAIRRVYGFEYSDTGNNRRRGSVTLIGSQVIALHLAAPPAPETPMWY